MGDVVFSVTWLLPVTVPVGSPFLYIVVRNRRVIVYWMNLLFSSVPVRVLQGHLVVRRYVYQVALIDREFAQLGFLQTDS